MKNAEDVFSNADSVTWAKTVEKEFSYPVDSIILSSEGKLLSQLSINEIFKTVRSGKIGRGYNDVLKEAVLASNKKNE